MIVGVFFFLIADLGFYALPAKEELSPMFPHNSSSHEISTETNAFVQNSKVRELPIKYLLLNINITVCT